VSTHRSHTGVKLGAKQLNIFRIGCKTTQYFWIQSLIKKKINELLHITKHFNNNNKGLLSDFNKQKNQYNGKKKNTTKRLDFLFFSTLTVMSNKCLFFLMEKCIFTGGRPAVEIRPLFSKFLSLSVIEVFFCQRVYSYNHCI
jgi:hypothetical protein